jgi:Uma2 family endonuclease
MSLTGGTTGIRNAELITDFVFWNRKKKQGRVFDSSTGFKLPNGATYSPDIAWVSNERWESLPETQLEKHVPLCPDFVVELVSNSQNAEALKAKMEEYVENGCKLGWLIDPYNKITQVFRPKMDSEKVPFDQFLYGGQILKNFKIKISDII